MTKRISPCATCDHHLFGLPKTCDKCERCKKRIAYVEADKRGWFENGFDDLDEHELNPFVKKHFAGFSYG